MLHLPGVLKKESVSINVKAIPFLIVLMLMCTNVTGQKQYSFLQVNKSDGLINNKIECIYKDSRGFIWIGTLAGLSRYDGHSFKNFMHDSSDSTTIDDHYIQGIQEDFKGNLWLNTSWKPIVYDVKKERFYNNAGEYLGGELTDFPAYKVFCDNNKQIWIKDYNQHFFRLYEPSEKELVAKFPNEPDRSVQMIEFKHYNAAYYYLFENGRIECYDDSNYRLNYSSDFLSDKMGKDYLNSDFFVDSDGDFWFYGNHKGIYCYSATNKSWKQYTRQEGEVRLSSNSVHSIIQDEKGLLWIATDHGGINILNKYSGEIEVLYNQPDNSKSIAQNAVLDLFLDNNGIIWIATTKNGVSYYHESIHKFPHYKHIVSDNTTLPFSDVNCFVEDKKGNLWIGSNGGGLIYFDRQNNKYRTYRHQNNNPNSLSGDVIVSLFIDHNEALWVGTYTAGLNQFDGKNFKHFNTNSGNGLSSDNIWTITADDHNKMWIGTLGGGVLTYDEETNLFSKLPNKGSVEWDYPVINHVYKLNDGNMVIASANGLIFYNVKEERFKYHPIKNLTDPLPFGSESVFSIYEDSRGLLWFATREGVVVFNPQDNYLKRFTKQDGIAEDYITGIQEDEFQAIWVSTPSGLSHIFVNHQPNVKEYDFEVINYTHEDGLQSKGFNANASFKTSRGELIFGGADGFNMFKARDMKFNQILPKVVFTDFQVYNQSISPDSKIQNIKVLENSIVSTKEVVLKYGMNVFSVDFAALDFFIPSKIKYQFKLEGSDDDWQNLEPGQHQVTYANLKSGDYVLKVKAANSDGVWNDDYAALKITVLPPFYATPLAYLVYVIIIVLMLIYFRYSMIRKERIKFNIEQERLSAKRNREMDEMKLKFLTNVSHEFRTPLTLILTPLQRLLDKKNEKDDRKLLEIIDRNAKQLLGLVNQLLDFRKLELHGLRYNPSYADIVAFLNRVVKNFDDSFAKKDIDFGFDCEFGQLMLNFDSDKLQKVMMNLLSNALKFTPEKGKVTVQLTKSIETNEVIIRVSDTGIGIKEEEQDKIFVRFYQGEKNKKLGLSGSGIGLNLAREMVQLHNGTLRVESSEGRGSIFTVTIPVDSQIHESEEELVKDGESESLENPEEETNENTPSVLLVEDNEDFRTFMKETLQDKFTVYEACDGKAGLDLVHKTLPDLIISDIMMPVMDGMELCKELRKDIRTSHIPIVLLTARTADEDKIRGLEIGADDYITKPFNMELLFLRIGKLLEKRNEMQKQFQKNIEINPSEIQITSMDEKLINKAIVVVEDNISEASFSVEELSKELGMSRVYLYKKLVAITGKAPLEFIRIIRLKRGAQLLEKSQMTIAEVAYEVGFNSPRYFSKYFKEEYGMLPTAYIKSKNDAR
ncbi:MAG: response regulator [Bacteroidales bacterium]|nr:response regulator [Bacteroidales bacterium]